MSRVLLPKHVAAVVKCQKDPFKALEMFNSVKKEDGFKHTLPTYKCMVEKLGFHGEFEAMERVISEMRMNVDNSLLEAVYIGAMRSYGRKLKVEEAVNVFQRMEFYNCEPSVESYNAITNVLVEYGYFNQTHKVYMGMRDNGIDPDVYTYTIRIKSFCKTSRPHVALRLLNNVPTQGCEFNAVAYCTVIGGFMKRITRLRQMNCLKICSGKVYVPMLPRVPKQSVGCLHMNYVLEVGTALRSINVDEFCPGLKLHTVH